VLRIDQHPLRNPAEEPAGEIRFLADRGGSPRRLAEGYHLTLMKNWAIVDRLDSSTTGATLSEGLKPGRYDISVAGRGIGVYSTQVRVRTGKTTTVRLNVLHARRVARCGENALTAGKVALYTLGAVFYGAATVAVAIFCGDDDDDDDDEAVSADTSLKGRRDRSSPRPGSVGPYRKKD
jgi:hypothetical protein